MPSTETAFKKAVRTYAAENGVTFAHARRILLEQRADGTGPEAPHAAGRPVRMFSIQQEMREDMTLPYPFHVDEDGYVDNQQFWDGDPWFLVGFEDTSPAARAENLAKYGTERGIVLRREQFIEDPQAAVGLAPVFADINRKWATYNGPVIDVTVSKAREVHQPADLRANFRSSDGAIEFTIGVADRLARLPRYLLSEYAEAGWVIDGTDDEVLTVLSRGAGEERERLAEPLRDFIETLGEDESGYTVTFDAAEANAWLAKHEIQSWALTAHSSAATPVAEATQTTAGASTGDES